MAKKLLDQLSDTLRTQHYSYRTEKTCVHGMREPLFHRDVKTTLLYARVLPRGGLTDT